MKSTTNARRRAWCCGLAAATGIVLASLAAPAAMAQPYPNKPIRMIIPNPPGGMSDLLGRAIALHLQERLGQPVVPDNRTGAAGIIGAETVTKSKPDGYTLFMGNIGPNAINQSLYRKLPYDAEKGFTPISLVLKMTNVLIVHPSVKANSVQDIVALAKAKPGTVSFGSSGTGQSPHLSGEMFMKIADVKMLHVPYRGAAPSMVALLGGEVNMIFENITNAMQHIKAGKVRPIAVTSAQRNKLLPDLPTIAEAGLPGYEVTSWFGVFGPAGLPQPILDQLNREIRQWIDLPENQAKIGGMGGSLVGSTPAEFANFVKGEIDTWRVIVERAGLQTDGA